LWIVVSALLVSLAWWLTAQLLGQVAGESTGAAVRVILETHGLVFAACLMTASVALLFALNRRPGRNVLRGAFWATDVWALCLTGLFLVEAQLKRMTKPALLIETTLLINPVAAVSTAFGMDILRTNWVYDHTSAPEYLFAYPNPLLSASVFVCIAIALLMLAAIRLRRAYR
jgi:hypothetical protein